MKFGDGEVFFSNLEVGEFDTGVIWHWGVFLVCLEDENFW
jgi:hypothetical protein